LSIPQEDIMIGSPALAQKVRFTPHDPIQPAQHNFLQTHNSSRFDIPTSASVVKK